MQVNCFFLVKMLLKENQYWYQGRSHGVSPAPPPHNRNVVSDI